ncbi:MAG: hypothetical protein CL536_03430 [Alcaligenaceae bacterium]|nr:hypothetical protein [Alcaligenaceae bacterium]
MTTEKDTDSTPGYGQPVNNCPKRMAMKGINEQKLTALQRWAQWSIDEYGRDLRFGGEPHCPQESFDLIDLIKEYRALVKEKETLAAHNQYCEALIAKLRGDKQNPQGPIGRLLGGRV